MDNPTLGAYAAAAQLNKAAPNDSPWASVGWTCANEKCGAWITCRARSHCRTCGVVVCANCITVVPSPPVYTSMCKAAPIGTACKLCPDCVVSTKAADEFCAALRVLVVLMACGAHHREWFYLAKKCKATNPLGFAARFLLRRYNMLTGPSARFAASDFTANTTLDHDLVQASGPSIRPFDLVYHTEKVCSLLRTLGPHKRPVVRQPLAFFVSILVRNALGNELGSTDGYIPAWLLESFHEQWQAVWSAVYPLLPTPQSRTQVRPFLSTTHARSICLNAPAGDPIGASKAVTNYNRMRTSVGELLDTVVLTVDDLEAQQQNFKRFLGTPRKLYYRGHVVEPRVGRIHTSTHLESGVEFSCPQASSSSSTSSGGGGGGGVKDTTVMLHFTQCPFDFLRASAFCKPTVFNPLFLDQLLVRPGWRCVLMDNSREVHAETTTGFDVETYSLQCVMLSLLQAGHKKHVDRLTVRRVVTEADGKTHVAVLGFRFREDVEEEEKRLLAEQQQQRQAEEGGGGGSTAGGGGDAADSDAGAGGDAQAAAATDPSTSNALTQKQAPLCTNTDAERVATFVCRFFEEFREECHWAYRLLHCTDGSLPTADKLAKVALPQTVQEFREWVYII